MALKTINVMGQITLPDGSNPGSCLVTFKLSNEDRDTVNNTNVVPEDIQVSTDATGNISVPLWPNDRGPQNTWYTVIVKVASASGVKSFPLGVIQLVDGPDVRLEDLLSVSVASLPAVDFTAAQSAALAKQYADASAANAAAALTGNPPALSITLSNYTVVDQMVVSQSDWYAGGFHLRALEPGTSWYNEARPSGSWLGEATNEAAARGITGAGTGDSYHNTTDSKFYSLDATSGETEIFRGPRPSMPMEILVIAEAGRVILFDVNDNCAMWMVFIAAGGLATDSNMVPGDTITAVAAHDGLFCIATGNSNSGRGGVKVVNFMADTAAQRGISAVFVDYNGGISTRNNRLTFRANTGVGVIVNAASNSVAITALPDAPINQVTGMPEPTIVVATDGGISQIGWDGVGIDNVWDVTGLSICDSVAFSPEGRIVFYWTSVKNVYIGDILIADAAYGSFGATYNETNIPAIFETPSFGGLRNALVTPLSKNNFVFKKLESGANEGISFLKENPMAPASGMVSFMTTSYLTGYMIGDIRGAWLADTAAEMLTGSELVTNGDFGSDSDWTKGPGWAIASGGATSDGTQTADALLTTSTVPATVAATEYVVSFEITTYTAGNVALKFNGAEVIANKAATGVYSKTVTASDATGTIDIVADLDFIGSVDNVSLRLAVLDRSIKGNGLSTFGSVSKAAVATGADLMWFSGFSAANYLEQPYNVDLDFGTGAFGGQVWVSAANLTVPELIFERDSAVSAQVFKLYLDGNNVPTFHVSDGTSTGAVTGDALAVGVPTLLSFYYDGAGEIGLSVNGNAPTTVAGAALLTMSNPAAKLRVGLGVAGGTPAANCKIALLRIGATAPSASQISAICDDEKLLFAESAAATIGGGSDAVLDVAYDDGTGLIHVLTSAGEHVFRGFVRIAYNTGTWTKISANNGLVVKL